MDRLVIALGGNALLPPNRAGSFEEMRGRVAESARSIVQLANGASVVLTHGNGPQVGNLLLQVEAMRGEVAPPPLDVLVAETQAQIGYLLQQALVNEMASAGRPGRVVAIVTQVVVDAGDRAFREPSKPVGPTISSETDAMLKRAKGWTLKRAARGGWRRVVPSPRPLEIVEAETIRALADAGVLVIAAGGGGVPVVRGKDGLRGVEAVVDKDHVAALLARDVGATRLLLATDVDRAVLHFGTEAARPLETVSLGDARQYYSEGHFPDGSMGPKVEAAIAFVAGGGREAIITNLTRMGEALAGSAGTHVVP